MRVKVDKYSKEIARLTMELGEKAVVQEMTNGKLAELQKSFQDEIVGVTGKLDELRTAGEFEVRIVFNFVFLSLTVSI